MCGPLCRAGRRWVLCIHQPNLDTVVGGAHILVSPLCPAFSAHLPAALCVCTSPVLSPPQCILGSLGLFLSQSRLPPLASDGSGARGPVFALMLSLS